MRFWHCPANLHLRCAATAWFFKIGSGEIEQDGSCVHRNINIFKKRQTLGHIVLTQDKLLRHDVSVKTVHKHFSPLYFLISFLPSAKDLPSWRWRGCCLSRGREGGDIWHRSGRQVERRTWRCGISAGVSLRPSQWAKEMAVSESECPGQESWQLSSWAGVYSGILKIEHDAPQFSRW